jgi:hypothetical protein
MTVLETKNGFEAKNGLKNWVGRWKMSKKSPDFVQYAI